MFSAASFRQAKTFTNVLTFDEAMQRHGMVRDVVTRIVTVKSSPDKAAVHRAQAKQMLAHLQDAWNECMGCGDPDSDMASAVRVTIPLDYVPLMLMRSGIPAAYFVVKLAEHLQRAATDGEDLSDDMVLRQCASRAFDEFEWKRQNAATLEEGFGCDRSAAWAQLRQVDDQSSNPNVKRLMMQVAELAGRMFKAFQYQPVPNRTNEPQEVDGVETGGELERMLDDEAASMGIDPEVAVRVSDDRAYQYQMSGESTKCRGPLVLAIDESGSMHEQRAVWAKACSVALARIALAEGRAVRVVHFSTATDVHDVKPNDPQDMLLLSQSHCSGGTDIDTAMRVALDQVGNLEKNGHEGADIVFITDGLDNYSEEPFKQMAKQGVQLWTVAIDVDLEQVAKEWDRTNGSGYVSSPWLYKYARAYVHVDDHMINNGGAMNSAVKLRQAAFDNQR